MSLVITAPQPLEPWDGIRNATAEGNSAIQYDDFFYQEYIGDEDCLYLNIYTPNLDEELRSVMIYVYGGHYRFGSGSAYIYGGDYLVEKDVVVVTINYRGGALGFLSLNTPEVPGNAALKDVVQAIRWIKSNIARFGGDPDNLTVFGESSGASIVSLLTASPLSKNLISKAIIQSGSALCNWAYQNNPLESVRYLGWQLGLNTSDVNEIYKQLLTTPAIDIVKATHAMNPLAVVAFGKTIFGPVVEEVFSDVEAFLTEPFVDILSSGGVADIPIIIGSNALEFTFGTSEDTQLSIPADLNIAYNSTASVEIGEEIKQLYFTNSSVDYTIQKFQLLSDFMINIAAHRYVQYFVNVKDTPLYTYKFGYIGKINLSQKIMQSVNLNFAGHMDELSYLFKNEYLGYIQPSAKDIEVIEKMVSLWTNFAKTGNPTPDDHLNVTWLPASKNELNYLNISDELTMDTYPDKEKMTFWEDVYSKYYNESKSNVSTREVVIIDTKPFIPIYAWNDHQNIGVIDKLISSLYFVLSVIPAF